jgi:hypothetical protein
MPFFAFRASEASYHDGRTDWINLTPGMGINARTIIEKICLGCQQNDKGTVIVKRGLDS